MRFIQDLLDSLKSKKEALWQLQVLYRENNLCGQ